MTIKEFHEKAATDTEPQAKVAEAAKSGKALEVILKDLGIDATVEEFKAFVGANHRRGQARQEPARRGRRRHLTPTIATVVPACGVTISVSSAATC